MNRSSLLLAAALASVSLTTSVAGAQVRLPAQPPIRQLGTPTKPSGDSQPVIPPAYRPPPGMCRIWLDNVPAQQQPASTDCASAVRNRPTNGRVIFGDDYIERREERKDKDKKPRTQVDVTGARPATDDLDAPSGLLALAPLARVHGPQADDALDFTPASDARPLEEPGVAAFQQPPVARRRPAPARPRVAPADSDRDRGDVAPDRRSTNERRADGRQTRRDSARDAQDRRRAEWDARRGGTRDGRSGDGRSGDGRSGDVRDDRYDGRYDDRYGDRYRDTGYGDDRYDGRYADRYADGRSGYDSRYVPRGRANGTCLDRDGDGWCDDSRTGGGYCRDVDGDGRCDDYPGLASAPYASALPPMRAATDVQRGSGSEAALRWLGTAEVSVRTSELKRTGSPYRAMWLDANTGRLLQVWTDRDGDGIADRVEVYRDGRIVKTIGR